MNRAELVAHITRAEQRFQARIASVKWFARDEIAAAALSLAEQLEPVDCTTADAYRKLGALIKTPRELRDAQEDALPSSRRPPSSPDRYSMPPDKEGDEQLLERRNRFR